MTGSGLNIPCSSRPVAGEDETEVTGGNAHGDPGSNLHNGEAGCVQDELNRWSPLKSESVDT